MWDLHAEKKNRNQSCQKNSDFPMIFFTFMTARRHCRSRSAADCTFTIIHAEEWNLIWSISGWAPPMDCKKSKRYNELDAGTREVNGEINPNAQTESDKTSFFYYNISDFLVFYIYIHSYIFIYMLTLQLRRTIWNKCWFNIRVCKKKKSASFFLTDTNVLKSFSKDQLKVKGQLRGAEGTAAWAMIQQRGRGRR